MGMAKKYWLNPWYWNQLPDTKMFSSDVPRKPNVFFSTNKYFLDKESDKGCDIILVLQKWKLRNTQEQ